MSSLQEIEAAIRMLPPREQDSLFSWIEEQYAQPFDARLRSDVQSGALDGLVEQAIADDFAGNSRPL